MVLRKNCNKVGDKVVEESGFTPTMELCDRAVGEMVGNQYNVPHNEQFVH